MTTEAKWKRLLAVSEQQRDSQEESRRGRYRIRKAAEADAVALAKDQTRIQWEIRQDADAFLRKNGFGSSGRKRGRKIPGL
jgi:hypothetical protein